MDPSDTQALKKVTRKKLKADIAFITGEPSEVQAMVTPELEVVLSIKVTPPIVMKCSRSSNYGAPQSITFEGILGDQALRSEVCAFDN